MRRAREPKKKTKKEVAALNAKKKARLSPASWLSLVARWMTRVIGGATSTGIAASQRKPPRGMRKFWIEKYRPTGRL